MYSPDPIYSVFPAFLEEALANDSAKNEKSAPMTAGQRLAAQQAAKAARKSAQRGRDAELVEEKALAQAAVAKDWLEENLKPLGIAAGVILLVAAVGIGWSSFSKNQNEAAGAELTSVLEGEAKDPEAQASAYAAVAERHPRTLAAAWARVSEGAALYEQGKWELARKAYEAALEQTDDEGVRWAALEGMAYTLEEEHSYERAIERLEELRALDQTIAPIAGYQEGRILLAQGKLEEARIKFEAVLNDLKSPEAPLLPYTREQTEARLALIDPSGAPAAGTDPRRAEEFMRQMNELLQRQPPQE